MGRYEEPFRGRISIHALLAESDLWVLRKVPIIGIFLSTLSLRRATGKSRILCIFTISFLSTLSLRRATMCRLPQLNEIVYFYPRSPCGERQSSWNLTRWNRNISIHALLAESDLISMLNSPHSKEFLSTLSLRRATHSSTRNQPGKPISIHALLAESDVWPGLLARPFFIISIHALLAESDPGKVKVVEPGLAFLSTLSLRRATSSRINSSSITTYFYPRSPCGERLLII